MRGPVPATPDPPDSEPPIVADRPIVLVVDDVEATCRSYRRFLGPDFDARLETSAEAATARIRRDRHDALLVDLRLVEKDIADRSGLDVIRAFRGRGERGPVLLVTGIDLGKLDVGREIIQVLDGLDAQFATKGESLPTIRGWASRVRAHALVARLDRADPARANPETLDERRERAVRAFCREKGLAARYVGVIACRLQHKCTATIARELGITKGTVNAYEAQIREHLGVDDLGPVFVLLLARIASP